MIARRIEQKVFRDIASFCVDFHTIMLHGGAVHSLSSQLLCGK